MAYGDSIVVCSYSDPVSLNPLEMGDLNSHLVTSYLFSRIIRTDAALKPVPDLCQTFEVSDDNMTVYFKFPAGIIWHDGVPFSVEDVLFTFDLLKNSAMPGRLVHVQTLECLDSQTLKAIYMEKLDSPVSDWDFPIVPKHLLDDPEKYAEFSLHPVGTGPFRFREWVSGEHIILDAYKDYHRGRPFLESFITKIVPDNAQSFVMLLRGELDLLRLSPDQYIRATSDEKFNKQYNVFSYPSRSTAVVALNLNNPLFKDPAVRRAITMAIDRVKISKDAFRGLSDISSGPFPAVSFASDPAVSPLPYHPEEARKILAEAGFSDSDNDGILEKDGKAFSFRHLCSLSGTGNIINKALQFYLREAGIDMILEEVSWKAQQELCWKGQFDSTFIVFIYGTEMDAFETYHSSQIPCSENSWSGENISFYRSSEADKIMEEIRKSETFVLKKKLSHRLHQLLNQECPHIFMYSGHIIWAVHNRFYGINKTAPGGAVRDHETWFVPERFQKYR